MQIWGRELFSEFVGQTRTQRTTCPVWAQLQPWPAGIRSICMLIGCFCIDLKRAQVDIQTVGSILSQINMLLHRSRSICHDQCAQQMSFGFSSCVSENPGSHCAREVCVYTIGRSAINFRSSPRTRMLSSAGCFVDPDARAPLILKCALPT